MSEHNDLLEAALRAVNAVTAKTAEHPMVQRVNDMIAEDIDEDAGTDYVRSDDVTTEQAPLNISQLGGLFLDEVEQPEVKNESSQELQKNDSLDDFQFSISAFNRILDDAPLDTSDLNVDDIAKAMAEPMPPMPIKLMAPICNGTDETSLVSSALPAESAPGHVQYDELVKQIDKLSTQLDETADNLAKAQSAASAYAAENKSMRVVQNQLNDRIARISADFENYRKRTMRDQDLMRKQAEERIVATFLSVMDNFERAIAHAKQSSDTEQLLRGVELTSRLYLSTLAKHGCVPFDSVGQTFDPNYHDVLQRVIDPDAPDNVVVQEHLKGYIMHDRVIRPALVVVSLKNENGSSAAKTEEADSQACVNDICDACIDECQGESLNDQNSQNIQNDNAQEVSASECCDRLDQICLEKGECT